MSHEALARAVKSAGSQKALADGINVRQSDIWYWLNRAKRGVPAEHVAAIEARTGIPRHELRPDIYPAPEQRAAS